MTWLRRILRRNGSGGQQLLFVLLMFPLLCLMTVFFSTGGGRYEDSNQLEMDERLNEIKEHLDHLRQLDKEKSKAFLELKNQLSVLIAPPSSPDRNLYHSLNGSLLSNWTSLLGKLNGSQNWWRSLNLPEKAKSGILANLSVASLDIAVPNIYDFLPHLLNQPNSLNPMVKLSGKNRRGMHTVIGIPTIRRPKISYLVTTLRSLMDNLSPDEQEQVLIVVLLADEGGLTRFVSEQLTLLQAEFPEALDTGLLEIIVPSPNFYPPDLGPLLTMCLLMDNLLLDEQEQVMLTRFISKQLTLLQTECLEALDTSFLGIIMPSLYFCPPDLDAIPSTFEDPTDRMRWRTKQNLDYAYLMMFCQNRGRYYLQLEDDVITKAQYLALIKRYIAQQTAVPWLLLEFSYLGFIGKLFKSADLPVIVEFILMFHREKPVDWLLDHVFYVRFCHPEKTPKQCQAVKNKYRLRHKPSLFQHIGVHSSLKGKVQKLKERDFGKQPLHKSHLDNPEAIATTSLKIYQKYSLDGAYRGSTFFWGLLPQPNDWIRFDFKPPIRLEGFLFRSGNAEHPDDRFYNTSVEVKFVPTPELPPFGPQDGGSNPTEEEFTPVAWFSVTGTAQATLNTTAYVQALRLVTHSESDNWVILSEIWIRPLV